MLKPFHIRDLRSHPEPASPSNPALIRISTTDYDDIASNHPRARLTYVDEDDDGDETITVSVSHFRWQSHVLTGSLGWICSRAFPTPRGALGSEFTG